MIPVEVKDDTEDEGTEKEPLYWFKQQWMQNIYIEGVELVSRLRRRNLPRAIADETGLTFQEGTCRDFYWVTIDSTGGMVPTISSYQHSESHGFRLFAMADMEMEDFKPVVDIRKVNGNKEFGLFAARNYKFGNAIIFLSGMEERSGAFVLGGTYARTAYLKERCNVFVTKNRALRCMRRIEIGEELVRWIQSDESTDGLETIDQVVFSPDTMTAGRIFNEIRDKAASARLVYFGDNRVEIVKWRHLIVYKNLKYLEGI